jgi:hypothetical protein
MTEEALRGWYWAGVIVVCAGRVGWLVHAVSRSLTGRTAGLTRELSPATEFVFREAMHGSTDFRRVRFGTPRISDHASHQSKSCMRSAGKRHDRVAIHMPEHGAPGAGAGSLMIGSEAGGDVYKGVTCLACRQVHMVHRRIGRVLGADDE